MKQQYLLLYKTFIFGRTSTVKTYTQTPEDIAQLVIMIADGDPIKATRNDFVTDQVNVTIDRGENEDLKTVYLTIQAPSDKRADRLVGIIITDYGFFLDELALELEREVTEELMADGDVAVIGPTDIATAIDEIAIDRTTTTKPVMETEL